MRSVKRAKEWLALVDKTSWHYQLVDNFSAIRPKKACTYYWVCIPEALFKGALLLALVTVFRVFGRFLGFTSRFSDATSHGDMFYPYKTKRNGKRKLFAPWEVVAAALSVWFAIFSWLWGSSHIQEVVAYMRIAMAIVAILAVTYLVVYVGGRFAWRFFKRKAPRFKKFWDGICPDLVLK